MGNNDPNFVARILIECAGAAVAAAKQKMEERDGDTETRTNWHSGLSAEGRDLVVGFVAETIAFAKAEAGKGAWCATVALPPEFVQCRYSFQHTDVLELNAYGRMAEERLRQCGVAVYFQQQSNRNSEVKCAFGIFHVRW